MRKNTNLTINPGFALVKNIEIKNAQKIKICEKKNIIENMIKKS